MGGGEERGKEREKERITSLAVGFETKEEKKEWLGVLLDGASKVCVCCCWYC